MEFKKKDIDSLIIYLKEHEIDPVRARAIIHKSVALSPTNRRSLWKMHRFMMYVHQRLREWKQFDGHNNGKKRSVIQVVQSNTYRDKYKTYPFGFFNEAKEIKNLYQLVTDPRQQIHFTSKNFCYLGTSKPIPQELLDKIC